MTHRRYPVALAALALAAAFAGTADAAPRTTSGMATIKKAPDPKAEDVGLVATVSANAPVDLAEWSPDRKWARIAVEGKSGWIPADKIKLLPEDMEGAKRAEAEKKDAEEEAKRLKDAEAKAEQEAQRGAPFDFSPLAYPEPKAEGRWRVVLSAADVKDKDGKALGKLAVGHRVRVAGEAGDAIEVLARDGQTRGLVAKAALSAQDGVDPAAAAAATGQSLTDDDPFAAKKEGKDADDGKPKRERVRAD